MKKKALRGVKSAIGVYKVCQTCGKSFFVECPNMWIYRTGTNTCDYFCSYSCKCKWEKEKEMRAKRAPYETVIK